MRTGACKSVRGKTTGIDWRRVQASLLRRKLRTAARLARYEPSTFLLKTGLAAIPKRLSAHRARAYIERVGLRDLLVAGKTGEFGLTNDKAVDLRNLHRLVRT